jgi:peptide/nickel transport system substrate-binding protein/oligopeptide transport system substrate-binding protein
VPQALIQQYGSTWTNHLADCSGFSGGLFKVTRWDHAGHLTLDRNDAFWGTKPRLREIQFAIYRAPQTAYSDYQAHRADIAFPSVAQFPQVRTQPDFHQVPLLSIDRYAMDWTAPPFTDVGMRQAFAMALDKQQLADQTWHGAVIPTNHLVPQGMPGYNPKLTAPDGTQTLSGDRAFAHQQEQAYVRTHCGGVAARCPSVALYSFAPAPLQQEAQAVVAMWRQAFPGYPISINPCGGTLMAPPCSLQVFVYSWSADYPDPQDDLSLQFLPDAWGNLTHVSDAQATTDMALADGLTDQSTRIPLYQDAEQRLVKDVAWLPLDQWTGYWQARTCVVNYNQDAQDFPSVVDQWPAVYIAQH